MPGLPQMALAAGQGQPGQPVKSDQPCPFYETNGICYMGAACPYKHGQDPVVVKGDGTVFAYECFCGWRCEANNVSRRI